MPFTSVDEPSCGGGARVLFLLNCKGATDWLSHRILRRIEGLVAKAAFKPCTALLRKRKKGKKEKKRKKKERKKQKKKRERKLFAIVDGSIARLRFV